MKPAYPFLATLLSIAAWLHADLVMVQKVEGGGQAGEQTIRIKGDKARTDMSQFVSIITDGATGDMVTLMHAQKVYMKVPAAQTKAMMEQMQKLRANGGPPKLQPTGKKEKIGEYECEIFTASLGFLNVTYWFAPNFPNFKAVSEQLEKLQAGSISAMSKGVMPEMKDFPGMPIKTEMDLNGKKVTTILVSAKEEAVDPAIFNIPPSYKEGAPAGLNLQPSK